MHDCAKAQACSAISLLQGTQVRGAWKVAAEICRIGSRR